MNDPWELIKSLTSAIQPFTLDPCKPSIADCRFAREIFQDAKYHLKQRSKYVPDGYVVLPESAGFVSQNDLEKREIS